ncbi:hypothetical protein SAMN02745176_01162 [Lutispora thermophila DSM 19022]|uniref:Uncharacterized protein n=1 Tax=Lutispora thermophila DSM 19022 TaxID=1122184 RepID=A0A1M6DKX9_9FIRM|nr:hypothetical protein SAMN02745176_01162 [Lutispora thermophila DSM 19022]
MSISRKWGVDLKYKDFEDEILYDENDESKYPHMKRIFDADFYTLDFDPSFTKFDDEVFNDDYEGIRFNRRMWRDIFPQ